MKSNFTSVVVVDLAASSVRAYDPAEASSHQKHSNLLT